jgi:DNA-nicking Smr family endonuclease
MSARRPRDPDEPDRKQDAPRARTFADEAASMPDLEPLGKGKGQEAPRKRTLARPDQATDSPVAFHFPEPDEPLLGIAAGIQTRQLRDLRRGRIRPEVEIDLHGLRAEEARRRLLNALCRAAENQQRCLVVIHGKGLRSPGRPVLRSALPVWLADPELAGCVLAFAPACPHDGGSGATYVLLRRNPSR